MVLTTAEENYLKAIFALSWPGGDRVSTNDIAGRMQTAAASVTDMLKRLHEKDLVRYERYKGVELSALGDEVARRLVRKHRLWEVFLVENLRFTWDEVHEVAEQLEHIRSPKLIDRLDEFLGFPERDPHGDPIPDRDGHMERGEQKSLAELPVGDDYVVVGVSDTSPRYLKFLDELGVGLGTELSVLERRPFDGSMVVRIRREEITLSERAAVHLLVRLSN